MSFNAACVRFKALLSHTPTTERCPREKTSSTFFVLPQSVTHITFHFGREEMLVELRDLKNLGEVLRNISVAPNRPLRFSKTPASMLLYAYTDDDETPAIDCVEGALQEPRCEGMYWEKQEGFMKEYCFLPDGQKTLVVYITRGGERLQAEKYQDGKFPLEWRTSCRGSKCDPKLSHLAFDKENNIWATDLNNKCVQLFTRDGNYLGAILQFEEHKIGEVLAISYCDPYLIISHSTDGESVVSTFQVK